MRAFIEELDAVLLAGLGLLVLAAALAVALRGVVASGLLHLLLLVLHVVELARQHGHAGLEARTFL
eukprot:1083394-Heterocapsa_arctica.AAC.1